MSLDRPFDAYVPRGVLRHLAREPFDPVRIVEGSMLFADLSGFTKLSERLQRRGPEGAELLVGTVNGVFASLLRVAYDNDGSLIKFGGDALLLFFEGQRHAARAARSAFLMRERLRTVGRIDVAGVRGVLRMTVGIHSDTFHFFLVGESHLEHLVLGPGATGTVQTEGLAQNGQIVVSATTAALLPAKCVGQGVGDAFLLRAVPVEDDLALMEPLVRPPNELVGRCLSTAVRAHVTDGASAAEHRRACVAFLQFKGTNAILAQEGPAAVAAALHELVADVQRAADQHEVCFLDSDIDADGGKLLLTAGAPRVVGDDAERLLLTLRQIVDGERRLPIRVGVNRGPTFTGEIGPPYRRSYIVMGDTTNLAARVMGKSTMGQIWATPGILERSSTSFETTTLEPFAAKGKAKLVQAYAVGPPLRRAAAAPVAHALPLIGREAELSELADVVDGARLGRGALVELNGLTGVGKSRLLEELQVDEVRRISVACEAHLSAVPYSLWHGLLRRLLGLAWADEHDTVVQTLRERAAELGLEEDLPLLGDVLGVELPATERSAALLPQFRAARTQEAVLALLTPERMMPTLLEVDSAHLIDEASAGLLGAFAPHLPTSNWAVLLVQRAGHGHRIAPPDRRIELEALPAAAAQSLAHAATDAAPLPPRRVAEAVARSGGNPQFLLDLLAATGTDLPDSAQAAAMAQIDALAPGDRLLVRRASLLGSTFPPELAAAVLGAEPAAWDRVASIVARTPDGHLRFVRATLREAAYAAVPWAERRALHARVAQALEAGAGGPVDPGVLAEHYRRADRHDLAYPLARRAASRALARSAPADAAGLFRDALDSAREISVPPAEQAELWEGLGDALRLAAEGAAADRAYRQARRTVGADRWGQARLLHRQSRLAQRAGHPAAGVRWARRGVRVLDGADGTEAWRARLLAAEAANRMDQGRRKEAARLCEQAIALASATPDDPVAQRALAHAGFLLDWALFTLGRRAEATNSPRSLELYEQLGELEDASHVLNNMGMFAYWEGRWDDAVRLYRETGELAERLGDEEVAATSNANLGEVLSDQGHWDAAVEALRHALRIWRAADNSGGTGFARMLLGRTAARAGRSAEGVELLEAALAELSAHGMEDATLAQAYLAEALALAGDAERATPILASLLARGGDVEPLALRARAQLGGSRADLLEALEAARRAESDYDVGLALDLLVGLPAGDEEGKAWADERDELFARLGVVRLPWS